MAGLTHGLAASPDIKVIATAPDPLEAPERVVRAQPDVVAIGLVDVDEAALRLCADLQVRAPSARLILLVNTVRPEALIGALQKGVRGCLFKDVARERIAAAIRDVADGLAALGPRAAKVLIDFLRGPLASRAIPDITDTPLELMRPVGSSLDGEPLLGLTEQERRIALLLAEGKTNPEIAAALGLSPYTIKTYVSRILQKLDVSRRSQVAAYAARGFRTRE